MISCFEVVPLNPAPTIIQDLQEFYLLSSPGTISHILHIFPLLRGRKGLWKYKFRVFSFKFKFKIDSLSLYFKQFPYRVIPLCIFPGFFGVSIWFWRLFAKPFFVIVFLDVQEWAIPFEFYLVRAKFFGNLSNMSVCPVVNNLIKRRDIYQWKITSALNNINASENLVKNSFLAQKELAMNWLSSVSHMNEEILNAFIENEVDAEIIEWTRSFVQSFHFKRPRGLREIYEWWWRCRTTR